MNELSTQVNSTAMIPFEPNSTLTAAREVLLAVAAMLQGDPAEFVVVSPTMTEHAHAVIKAALATQIVTEEDYKIAGERLNKLGKIKGTVKARYLSRGELFRAVSAEFKRQGDLVIDPATLGEEHVSKEMTAFRKIQEEQRQAAIKEQQRLQAEAEAKRQAEIAEAKRNSEAAAARVEAAKREQERLAWEAQERERLAAEGLMAPRTTETVAQGSQDLAAAAAVETAAEDARLVAQAAEVEAQALLAQQQQLEQQAAPVAAPVALPTITKAKGTKFKRTPELLGLDKSKLPLTYLSVDEALLKRHILDGAFGDVAPNVITDAPGVRFVIHEIAAGTGR